MTTTKKSPTKKREWRSGSHAASPIQVKVWVTEETRAEWGAAAEADGEPVFGNWIKRVVQAAANRALRKK